MDENYYKTLVINRFSNNSKIKKAYRLLAMKHHPDKSKNPESHEIFIKITEAYETLADTVKREEYNHIYEKYIKNKDLVIYERSEFKEKEREWESFGKKRAYYYSNMSFNDFMRKYLTKLSITVVFSLM